MQRSNSRSYKHRLSRSSSPCFRATNRINSNENSPQISNMNARFRTPNNDSQDTHSSILSRIDPVGLKNIKISIKRNIPVVVNPQPIQRSLDNPEQLILHRKDDEGQKPLFDREDVIPNLEPKIIEERIITVSTSRPRSYSSSSDDLAEQNFTRTSTKDYESKYRESLEKIQEAKLKSISRDNRINKSSPAPHCSDVVGRLSRQDHRSPARDQRHRSTRQLKSPERRRSSDRDERNKLIASKRSPRRGEQSPKQDERSRREIPRMTRSPGRDREGLRSLKSPRRDEKRARSGHTDSHTLKNTERSPRRKDDKSPKRRDDRSPKRKDDRSPRRRDDRSPKRKDDRSPRRKYDKSPRRKDDRSPRRRYERSPGRRDERSPRGTRRSRSLEDVRRDYSNRRRNWYEYERKSSRLQRERSRSRPRNDGYFKPNPSEELLGIRPDIMYHGADPNRYWSSPLRGMYFPKETLQHGVRWLGPPIGPPVLGPGPAIIPPRPPPFLGPVIPPFRPRFPPQPRIQYNSLTSYKLETTTSGNAENSKSNSDKSAKKDANEQTKKKDNSDEESI